jgi:hypothetical protein
LLFVLILLLDGLSNLLLFLLWHNFLSFLLLRLSNLNLLLRDNCCLRSFRSLNFWLGNLGLLLLRGSFFTFVEFVVLFLLWGVGGHLDNSLLLFLDFLDNDGCCLDFNGLYLGNFFSLLGDNDDGFLDFLVEHFGVFSTSFLITLFV